MYNDFKILSKNNTDELIFYKMIEKKNERENTIHLPSEKKKKFYIINLLCYFSVHEGHHP